ncbi:hypothetical protein ABZ484_25890 [Streptomyces sp. NPDC006393]|uniref:hypothetical protein n=1 Tax=Streptomyces sp. NPDC006393 TaxID=3156763 RepID=UPI00340D0EE8
MSDGRHDSATKVYLSDVEIHLQSPFASAEDLRARVLFHVLFCDELLVGDSQCLNTPLFRALVSRDEAGASPVRSDLGVLLDSGRIRVARRDDRTLREVRDSQELRGVDNVPSAEYAEAMDLRIRRHPVTYDLDGVAAAFKSGVLRLLGKELAGAEGVTRRLLEEARSWADSQQPLFYKSIRDWAEDYGRASVSVSTEVVLALDTVDRAAGEAYRQALPTVLGAGTAAPRGTVRLAASAGHRTVAQTVGLPADMLDSFLLGRLPVGVLLEATEQASRAVLVRELAVLRSGREPDQALLQEAVSEFGAWMHRAFLRAYRTTDERARAVLRGEQNLMRFGITQNAVTGALSASLEVPQPDDDGTAYLDVRFLEHGLPAADDISAAALQPHRLRQRAVVGSSLG